MADKKPDLTLINVFSGKPTDIGWQLDEGFVKRQQAIEEAEWRAAVTGGPGGEQAGAPTESGPPASPQVAETPTERPSDAALKAAGEAFVEGASQAAQGVGGLLGTSPGLLGAEKGTEFASPMQSVKKIVDGLIGMGMAPFAGLGAGAGQALQNISPGLAATEFASGSEALNYRAALSLRAVADLDPLERQAMSQPMSVREALETAVQLAPLVAGVGPKAKEMAQFASATFKETHGKAMEAARAAMGAPLAKAAEGPVGGGEPPRRPNAAERLAGQFEPEPRVNMERIGASESVKSLIAELDVAAQKAGLIHKEVVTRAETAAKAKGLDLTYERALKMTDLENLHANMTAIRDLRDHAFTQLEALRIEAMGATGPAKAVAEARAEQAAVIAALMEQKDVKLGTDIGRALAARGMLSDAARAYEGADIVKLVDQWKAGMLPGDSLVARLTQLRTKQQRQVFLKQLLSGANRGQNIFYEAWINGLLSNPVSHAANTISNALVMGWGVAERQMAGMFNVLLTRDPEGVRIGEAAIMTRSAIKSFTESLRVTGKVLRTGEDVFGGAKMEIAPALTAEGLRLDPTNPLSGAVDFIGSGIRLPSRLMMTEDAFFKWMNYRMDMEARAWREAGMRGLKGEDRANFIREWLEAPDMERRAPSEDYAAMQTFTRAFDSQSLTGHLGQAGQAFQRIPVIGRAMFPFMVTPVNVGGWAWRRLPAIGLISESLYRELGQGGAARDLALAKLGTGGMLAMAYVEMTNAGLITGAGVEQGDAKDALKQLGRQDYAVRVGDELYRINRLAPPGMMIGALASYAEIAAQLPEDAYVQLGVALAMVMAEAIKDQPFYQQLNHVIAAIQQPKSFTKGFIESNVRSLMPMSGLLHQVKKSGIPGVIEADPTPRITRALTEWETLKNMMIADLPGYSTTLPPRRNNITGEPIVLPPGVGIDQVSPVAVTKLRNDPVFEEVVRNRPSLQDFPEAMPGKLPPALQMDAQKALTKQVIPLTAQEQDEGIVIMTKEIKDGDGLNLYQSLRKLVESPEYQAKEAGEGGGRQAAFEQRYHLFWKAAKDEFLKRHPDIGADVRTLLEEKLNRRRGNTDKPLPPIQIAPGLTLPGAR